MGSSLFSDSDSIWQKVLKKSWREKKSRNDLLLSEFLQVDPDNDGLQKSEEVQDFLFKSSQLQNA